MKKYAVIFLLLLAGCATVDPAIRRHAVVGRWSAPIDGKPGFVREFFADGAVKVWWPDGRLAADGTFFVVDDAVVGVAYPNRDTDVVKIVGGDRIQIDHVIYGGSFRKYFAERVR